MTIYTEYIYSLYEGYSFSTLYVPLNPFLCSAREVLVLLMCTGAGVLALYVFIQISVSVWVCVSVCSCVRIVMWICPWVKKQHSPPERPRSCIVRGPWGSGWCVRSCESPGWWSSVLPRPETPARSPAPWRTLPGAAAASDPALLTRTYNSITSNQ